MILLDTNIISELMKTKPDANVIRWIDQQDVMQLTLSTITIAEISYGLNVLPEGQRKSSLEMSFNNVLREGFEYRVFAFDEVAAHLYGKIMSRRKELGKPMSLPDGQIAAIARAQNAAVATRNLSDFSNCGLELINPFESST